MRAVLIVTDMPMVRWSSFGEGGVVNTEEFSMEGLERAALACEWMASFARRAAAEGAGSLEDVDEWSAAGEQIRWLQSGIRPTVDGGVGLELR